MSQDKIFLFNLSIGTGKVQVRAQANKTKICT